MRNPFRYFNSSSEVIRLAVMMYIRYPLSLRQVEDLLFERGIDIHHYSAVDFHLLSFASLSWRSPLMATSRSSTAPVKHPELDEQRTPRCPV